MHGTNIKIIGAQEAKIFRFFIPCIFKYYDKGYQQMPLSFVVFLYYTSLPYMFRASISPSSGVFPAVAYLLPLGLYSAWPFVRVRLGLSKQPTDPDAGGQTAKHYMNQVATNKQQLGIPLMMG